MQIHWKKLILKTGNMTQKEKNIINQVIKDIKFECETLEELYLQTRSINLRWIKQTLEEKAIKQLKGLLK